MPRRKTVELDKLKEMYNDILDQKYNVKQDVESLKNQISHLNKKIREMERAEKIFAESLSLAKPFVAISPDEKTVSAYKSIPFYAVKVLGLTGKPMQTLELITALRKLTPITSAPQTIKCALVVGSKSELSRIINVGRVGAGYGRNVLWGLRGRDEHLSEEKTTKPAE